MKNFKSIILLSLLFGCAGYQRTCSSGCASNFGADWFIVQYGFDGTPIQCWELKSVSVANEAQSDGIYWQDSNYNLIHIAGWYNRVQVSSGKFAEARASVGIDPKLCERMK